MEPEEPKTSHAGLGFIMIVASVLIVIVMLSMFFDDVLDKQHNPNQTLSYTETEQAREVVLKRNRFGHYVSSGMINDTAVVFLVDTGATDVSIPEHVAQAIGLEKQGVVYYNTANGTIRAYRTRIATLTLGNIQLNNVKASINPQSHDNEVLLGMSFLRNLEFTQRAGTLTIRQYKP